MAFLLVLVFSVLGLIIYLILRPRETLAEAYARSLEEEALLQELEEQGIRLRVSATSPRSSSSAPTAARS